MRSSSVGPLLHTGTEARAVTMETYCFAKCGPNEMIFKKIDVGVFCIVTPISSCAGDMLNPPSPSPLPLFTTPPPVDARNNFYWHNYNNNDDEKR